MTKEEVLGQSNKEEWPDLEVVHKSHTLEAMDKWAEQFALDFAKFLEEHTEMIREEKITLYRHNSPAHGWANYTLEDIFIEFKEKYEG